MDKSNVLVNYRYVENVNEQEKYDINLQIQLEISKLMRKFVDEKKISVFHTGDNDYVAEIVTNEYYNHLIL